MYIVVRSDLTPGLQAAQAVHAGFFFAQEYQEITYDWMADSQYLVIVSVDSSEDLVEMYERAKSHNIASTLWSEPDLNHEPTALALEPSAISRILCANLPLAGKVSKTEVVAS